MNRCICIFNDAIYFLMRHMLISVSNLVPTKKWVEKGDALVKLIHDVIFCFNSIIFLFFLPSPQFIVCFISISLALIAFCNIKSADGTEPSFYSGKIIECSWDFDNLEWIFLRIRTDKSTPNEFNTYRKVQY
jgi:hypothetical protein